MKFIYIDTSVLIAILFQEPSAVRYQQVLGKAAVILSSYLLEAEIFSAVARERVDFDLAERYLDNVSLFLPDRSLRGEYLTIYQNTYCKGADAHHIACAMYLGMNQKDLGFLTADKKQAAVAKKIGLSCI